MKKITKILLIALASILLLAAAFVLYVNTGNKEMTSLGDLEPKLFTLSPQAVRVENVKQYTQPDAFTCGVTTISITASYLRGSDIPPESLITKYKLQSGMNYDQFADILSKEIPDYSVTYIHGKSDFELIKDIHTQLCAGIPVPVFFGAQNPYTKPMYDFHASVVTGLDLQNRLVDIVNAYGYTEQIPLTDFLNRMNLRGGSHYPFVQRAVIRLGLQNRNAMFAITKK